MIGGFQAQLEVNDAGTGAASGGASTKFANLVTLGLSELEVGTFDATELNQVVTGTTPDPYERMEATGLIKVGPTEGEMTYTKANYQRLQALAEKAALGDRGYTFVLTTPDDLTDVTPVKLTSTFSGFVSKVGAVKFEKGNPVTIPFSIVVRKKPTIA